MFVLLWEKCQLVNCNTDLFMYYTLGIQIQKLEYYSLHLGYD